MELQLLRHAKSDWTGDEPDHARRLNARGRAAAPQMGRHLLSENAVPDRILCSTAQRTRQTLQLLSAQWPDTPPTQFEAVIYEASLRSLLSLLERELRAGERLLLIGHNPGMTLLLAHLTRAANPDDVALDMPTCALARLQLDDDAPLLAAAQLLQLQHVRDLAD